MTIRDFADLMPHKVTIESWASEDRYGKPQYDEGIEYRARVVYKQTRIIDQESVEEVPARGHAWIGPPYNADDETSPLVASLTTRDRITLPDNTQPQLVPIERIPDEEGMHHVKVYFR